jgi:L-threonylcarbamoyladenylate synthase
MRINLSQAAEKLSNGQVVAVPTETVYGLAASLTHPVAIEQIFLLKGRPRSNPLIIHVANPQEIQHYVTSFPPLFDQLALAFWPGPMTLIVPIKPSFISSLVRADLETAGFRIPQHPLTLNLLAQTGPLVMPSANLSGRPSATTSDHVEEDFGASFPVLDGGACQRGLESTILYYEKEYWVIVRLGALSPESFQSVLGYEPEVIQKNQTAKPLCPGQSFRHYAPKAKLILGYHNQLEKVSFILGFTERSYPKDSRVIYMGSFSDPEEVAENLYHVLRQLDKEQATLAWVDMDFPKQGLWITIAERLQRAGE